MLLFFLSEISGFNHLFSSKFSDFVFQFLFGFSVGVDLWLSNKTLLNESVLWLELHHRVFVRVDESLSAALVSTKLSAHVHNDYMIGIDLELLGNWSLNNFLIWGSISFMDNFDTELFSVQKWIGHDFSCSDDKTGCHL